MTILATKYDNSYHKSKIWPSSQPGNRRGIKIQRLWLNKKDPVVQDDGRHLCPNTTVGITAKPHPLIAKFSHFLEREAKQRCEAKRSDENL